MINKLQYSIELKQCHIILQNLDKDNSVYLSGSQPGCREEVLGVLSAKYMISLLFDGIFIETYQQFKLKGCLKVVIYLSKGAANYFGKNCSENYKRLKNTVLD